MYGVNIWTGQDDLEMANAWVVKEEDEELFMIAAAESGIGDPLACVIATAASKNPSAFIKYLEYKLQNAGKTVSINSQSKYPDSQFFFGAWEHLVAGVNSMDLGAVRYAKALMAQYKSSDFFLWNTDKLVEVLERYVDMGQQLVSEESFLKLIPLSGRRDDWWESDCCWVNLYEALEGHIRGSGVAGSSLETALLAPLFPIRSQMRNWKRGSVEDAFAILWPSFVRSASVCLERGRYNWTVVYVHRALDAYFQLRGIQESVVLAGGGLSYRVPIPNRNRELVSLRDTERKLVTEAGWVSDHNRASFLRDINRARNLLRETHGAYGCSKLEAADAVERFERLIQRIGTSEDVSRFKESRKFLPTLSPRLIFEVEDRFDVFIVRIRGLGDRITS
jgi:hypothetical protein